MAEPSLLIHQFVICFLDVVVIVAVVFAATAVQCAIYKIRDAMIAAYCASSKVNCAAYLLFTYHLSNSNDTPIILAACDT